MALVNEKIEYGEIRSFSVKLPLWLDNKTRYQAVVESVRRSGDKPYQGVREYLPDGKRGKYIWDTGDVVLEKINRLSVALQKHGIKRGDKVGIMSGTRPEWTLADLACSSLGAIVVPIYDNYGPQNCEYIINSTEQVLIFASFQSVAFLKEASSHCPTLRGIVLIDTQPPDQEYLKSVNGQDPANRTEMGQLGFTKLYSELMSEGERILKENPNRPIGDPECKPDDITTVVFTSGTVGTPKGAMITENGLLKGGWSLIARLTNFNEYDTLISYLPIAHIFQRALEIFALTVPFGLGYFSGSVKDLMGDLQELKPTCFPVVPRVLNKIYNAVHENLAKKNWITQKIFDAALWLKKKENLDGWPTRPITDRIFRPVREMLGGRLRITFCGSAPLSHEVGDFINTVITGRLMEGYGQTEACGASFSMIDVDYHFGTVGLPCAGLEVCLRSVPEMGYYANGTPPRGELCMRGPPVFAGYWKDEELTKNTLKNGWLHTGDVGEWTSENTLKIIDRLKNVFKLQQGEFVYLDDIENSLSSAPLIKQIMLHGDPSMSALVGIVVPDTQELFSWAKNHGLEKYLPENNNNNNNLNNSNNLPPTGIPTDPILSSLSSLCSLPEVNSMLLHYIDSHLRQAKRKGYEIPKAIFVTPVEFSVDNGQLTPTFKIRRDVVRRDYEREIERMARAYK